MIRVASVSRKISGLGVRQTLDENILFKILQKNFKQILQNLSHCHLSMSAQISFLSDWICFENLPDSFLSFLTRRKMVCVTPHFCASVCPSAL